MSKTNWELFAEAMDLYIRELGREYKGSLKAHAKEFYRDELIDRKAAIAATKAKRANEDE